MHKAIIQNVTNGETLMKDQALHSMLEQMKEEINKHFNDGKKIRSDIKKLAWNNANGETLYNNYRLSGLKPETPEQLQMAKLVAKHFRSYRKSLKNSGTANERNKKWGVKKIFGSNSRNLLLAYALLRGKTYKSVEVKCRDNNPPNERKICDWIMDFAKTDNQKELIKSIVSTNFIGDWLDGIGVFDATYITT